MTSFPRYKALNCVIPYDGHHPRDSYVYETAVLQLKCTFHNSVACYKGSLSFNITEALKDIILVIALKNFYDSVILMIFF